MPKIPMLDHAAVQMQRENLPTYTPQKLESNAEALKYFAGAMDSAANEINRYLEDYNKAAKDTKNNAAQNQLKVNDYKAFAEMEAYAKEHPEDFANFEAKYQEISGRYAESNQEALDSMSFFARRDMNGVLESRAERRAFDVAQLSRRCEVEWGIKDLTTKSDEFMALGQYESARQAYRNASTPVEGRAPLLSREQAEIGIRQIDAREQFDLSCKYGGANHFMEVLE